MFAGRACASASDRHCVTFGPLPTTRTGTSAVDALLWIGRPWINGHVRPESEIANLVRYSPFL